MTFCVFYVQSTELAADAVEHIAAHYAKHPCIVGWQIDNEINCEINEFYSESDNLAFCRFLQEKYEDLDQLNQAWGTVFWDQTYTDWNQVYVPRTTINDWTNPHQMLDYTRFISESAIRLCRMQSDILRKYVKPVQADEECEIALRRKGDQEYLFVLNFSDQEQEICLGRAVTDLDDQKQAEGKVVLPAYGTKVYRI